MTLQQWQTAQGITNATLCRLLNEARPSGSDAPVHEHRLARLKDGRSRPTALERYLVQAATQDECCGYR